jgi:hypothetical protein
MKTACCRAAYNGRGGHAYDRAAARRGVHVTDERNDDAAGEAVAEPAEPGPGADHHLKRDVRDAVAKVVGIAVEAGSMLAGYSGEGVSAEGKVAEADAEQLIDRIDGEG